MSSFSNKKDLRFRLTLGKGKFADGTNQVIIQGFRATCDIDKAGFFQVGEAKCKIYGVSRDTMNACTTLTWQLDTMLENTLEVWAIDGADETLVFVGHIVNAWADYQGTPDVFLSIQARTCYWYSMLPVPPTSFKGEKDAAEIFAQLAKNMGLAFEGNGYSFIVRDQYLPNTWMEQARALAMLCGCDLYMDDRTLAITEKGKPRKADIPLISRDSGLIGYPTFDGVGINVKTIFHKGITFGGSYKLETDIEQARGQWIAAVVSHNLSSNMPNGPWFTTIRSNRDGLVK